MISVDESFSDHSRRLVHSGDVRVWVRVLELQRYEFHSMPIRGTTKGLPGHANNKTRMRWIPIGVTKAKGFEWIFNGPP